jgi:hypothetical protein
MLTSRRRGGLEALARKNLTGTLFTNCNLLHATYVLVVDKLFLAE